MGGAEGGSEEVYPVTGGQRGQRGGGLCHSGGMSGH